MKYYSRIYWLVLLKILIFVEGEKLYSLFYHSATAVQIGTNKILMLDSENLELVADQICMTGPTGQNDVLSKMGICFGNVKKFLNRVYQLRYKLKCSIYIIQFSIFMSVWSMWILGSELALNLRTSADHHHLPLGSTFVGCGNIVKLLGIWLSITQITFLFYILLLKTFFIISRQWDMSRNSTSAIYESTYYLGIVYAKLATDQKASWSFNLPSYSGSALFGTRLEHPFGHYNL